jgi:hypothetical protein
MHCTILKSNFANSKFFWLILDLKSQTYRLVYSQHSMKFNVIEIQILLTRSLLHSMKFKVIFLLIEIQILLTRSILEPWIVLFSGHSLFILSKAIIEIHCLFSTCSPILYHSLSKFPKHNNWYASEIVSRIRLTWNYKSLIFILDSISQWYPLMFVLPASIKKQNCFH